MTLAGVPFKDEQVCICSKKYTDVLHFSQIFIKLTLGTGLQLFTCT